MPSSGHSSRDPSLNRKGTPSSRDSSRDPPRKSTKDVTIDAGVLAELEEKAALYDSAMATLEHDICAEASKYVSKDTKQQIRADVVSPRDSNGEFMALAIARSASIKGDHFDRKQITNVSGFRKEFDAKLALLKKLLDWNK